MLFKMASIFPSVQTIADILTSKFWQTKSKKVPFSGRPEPISNAVYNTLAKRGIRMCVNGPETETNCLYLLLTSRIGSQSTNLNRNVAGISNSKSLPVSFFFYILKHWFSRLRPKTFPFPVLCDVVQDSVNFPKCLDQNGHFRIHIFGKQIQKGSIFGSS